MSLKKQLELVPLRETAGSVAQERFEYQIAWGISHLFELYSQGSNYAVGFEYHDDIIVIDSVTSPSKVRFYQVKTKADDKNWSIANLVSRQKSTDGLKASIIGKMFSNKHKFSEHAEHLGFVSNRPFKPAPTNKSVCCFSEIEEGEFKTFIAKLKTECTEATDQDADFFHYHHSDLPLKAYQATLKGKLVEFVSKHCGPIEYDYEGFFLAIVDECRQASKNIDQTATFEELVKAKFITKTIVDSWLTELKARACNKPKWEHTIGELQDISPVNRKNLHRAWSLYEVDQFQLQKTQISKLRDAIRMMLDENNPAIPHTESSLWNITTILLNHLKLTKKDIMIAMDDFYVRAAILYEWARQ